MFMDPSLWFLNRKFQDSVSASIFRPSSAAFTISVSDFMVPGVGEDRSGWRKLKV